MHINQSHIGYPSYFGSTDSFQILVKGQPIDQYNKDGKSYVEGRKGSEYKIKFRNNSNIQKKIVVTVDGINVITGKEDFTQGYVINGFDTIEIPGWRKDADNTAKFVFSSVKRSYNQRTDGHDVNNVGVIGCLVFDEEQPWYNGITLLDKFEYDHSPKKYALGGPHSWPVGSVNCFYSAGSSRSLNAVQCSATSSMPQNSVGTGYGGNASFKTVDVNINFKSTASQSMVIYYDSVEGLKHRGIIVNRKHIEPNPFPGYTGGVPTPVR